MGEVATMIGYFIHMFMNFCTLQLHAFIHHGLPIFPPLEVPPEVMYVNAYLLLVI